MLTHFRHPRTSKVPSPTMSSPRALVSAFLATLIAALAVTASASAKPTLGFADQKAAIFSDARLKDTGVKQARLNVPWDVATDVNTLPVVDAWLKGAKANGITPLITIDRSRQAGQQSKNPSNAQITAFVKGFKAQYGVKQFSAWNEGNLNKNAKLVAGWYKAAKTGCKTCTILAADLVDKPNAARWATDLIKAAKKLKAPKVTLFGLHNYVDVNNYRSTNTLAIAKKVKGVNFWLTETGGVLARATRPGSSKFKGTGAKHADKATNYLLTKLVTQKALKTRIKKIYLYSWSSAMKDVPGLSPTGTWDSGMIGPDGLPRPMLARIYKYQGRKPKAGLPIVVPPNDVLAPAPTE